MNLASYYNTVLKYNSSHTEDEFHAKLNDNINDHTAHLVYADWLQENNREAESDIIRKAVQQKEFTSLSGGRISSVRKANRASSFNLSKSMLISVNNNQSPTFLHLFIPDKTDTKKDFIYTIHLPSDEAQQIKKDAASQGAIVY